MVRQIGQNSGVAIGVQFERNSSEDQIHVLCEGAVSGGSSNVRNMAWERGESSFWDDAHKESQQCVFEPLLSCFSRHFCQCQLISCTFFHCHLVKCHHTLLKRLWIKEFVEFQFRYANVGIGIVS